MNKSSSVVLVIALFAAGRGLPAATYYVATDGKAKTEFRRNLYWDLSGKEPLFSGVSFAEWQRSGRDRDSRIADPQFRDASQYDFGLKPTSPALAMGFKPIATSQVGLYGDAAWVAAPAKIKREPLPNLPPPPPPPPPRPLIEDFESTEPGKLPARLSASPADRPDALEVSQDAAAGGRKSLKFTKTPGLKYGFQPHAYFASDRYTPGKVRFACDLLQDTKHPGECYVGLRDYTFKRREYLDGPSIVIKADGTVTAAGKPLTKVPPGKWAHLEIQLDLLPPGKAAAAPKTYRLAIGAAGETPDVFDAVPYADPQFSQFTWFGFSSVGQPGSVFYVDNLRLEVSRPPQSRGPL